MISFAVSQNAMVKLRNSAFMRVSWWWLFSFASFAAKVVRNWGLTLGIPPVSQFRAVSPPYGREVGIAKLPHPPGAADLVKSNHTHMEGGSMAKKVQPGTRVRLKVPTFAGWK